MKQAAVRAEKRHKGDAEQEATKVLEELFDTAVQALGGWSCVQIRGFTEAVDHLAMGVGEKGEDMALGSNQPTVRECLDNIDCYGYQIPSYPGSFDDRIGY